MAVTVKCVLVCAVCTIERKKSAVIRFFLFRSEFSSFVRFFGNTNIHHNYIDILRTITAEKKKRYTKMGSEQQKRK